MFWVWMLVVMLAVIGLSVAVGLALKPRGGRRLGPSEQGRLTALKASGALRHRKSNQP